MKSEFIEVALRAAAAFVEQEGKVLILNGSSCALKHRCHSVNIPELKREDQEFLFRALLPAAEAERLDYEALFAFAPKLTCRQIQLACSALQNVSPLSTEAVTEYLSRFVMDSNVELQQVEEVTFADLKGMDEILEALRVQVLVPLLHHEFRQELDLVPKRGVLL